ncbi:MAG: hypothetical protein SF339_20425 [Blastocatellia bacterium]|nr:hypothetical protein [Blastocatellia bacterium]
MRPEITQCSRALFSILLLALSAEAQTVTVRNFLNPDAPIARESFASLEGATFTDEERVEPFSPPRTLGGVTVRIDGIAQRIRSVSPERVVILVDSSGGGTRAVEVTTKSGATFAAAIQVATIWPGIFVQSSGEDSEAFIPSGLWTLDGIQLRPLTSEAIPVGPATRPTLVILQGSGWRLAAGNPGVSVRLNGVPCPVIAARASSLFAGQDELVFAIPFYLAGREQMDLTVSVAGRNSNYARINLGSGVSMNASSGKPSTTTRSTTRSTGKKR